MRYIEQYIKKLCPKVVVTNSKTTESKYYHMGYNFVVRLSEHIGGFEKNCISIVKSANAEDFIVIIDKSLYPLIKSRNEVKEMIKSLYEYTKVMTLENDYLTKSERESFERIDEWDKYWNKVCGIAYNAIYLSKCQKKVIKKNFDNGVKGEEMLKIVKKIKPTTPVEEIEKLFTEHKDKK